MLRYLSAKFRSLCKRNKHTTGVSFIPELELPEQVISVRVATGIYMSACGAFKVDVTGQGPDGTVFFELITSESLGISTQNMSPDFFLRMYQKV